MCVCVLRIKTAKARGHLAEGCCVLAAVSYTMQLNVVVHCGSPQWNVFNRTTVAGRWINKCVSLSFAPLGMGFVYRVKESNKQKSGCKTHAPCVYVYGRERYNEPCTGLVAREISAHGTVGWCGFAIFVALAVVF